MKKMIATLGIALCSANTFAYTQGAENVIKYLDEPYAVTHLEDLNVDCVWTKNENGDLENQNAGFEGTGVCWDVRAKEQLDALDKAGKLVWHRAAQKLNDAQYDEAATLLSIEKFGAEVNGCIVTQQRLDDELAKVKRKYQKFPVEFARGVKLGSYLREIGNYDASSCQGIVQQREMH